MIAESGIGFRAELVELLVAVAIAISLIVSIATAVGSPLLSFLHPRIKNFAKARFLPVFPCVLGGEEV
jgi:hypothetical protein